MLGVHAAKGAGTMGSFAYAVTLAVGLALGAAVGHLARPRTPHRKPTHAQVCGDLKLIHDLEKADSKAADKSGDKAGAAEHAKNAEFTKDWANRGGCSWAA